MSNVNEAPSNLPEITVLANQSSGDDTETAFAYLQLAINECGTQIRRHRWSGGLTLIAMTVLLTGLVTALVMVSQALPEVSIMRDADLVRNVDSKVLDEVRKSVVERHTVTTYALLALN